MAGCLDCDVPGVCRLCEGLGADPRSLEDQCPSCVGSGVCQCRIYKRELEPTLCCTSPCALCGTDSEILRLEW